MWNSGKPAGCGNVLPDVALLLTTWEKPSRNAATPSVATTLISFGARRRRRTTATSAAAPTDAETATAKANATQYGTCHLTTATPPTAAPNAPISPWAKLITRLDRYTSTS